MTAQQTADSRLASDPYDLLADSITRHPGFAAAGKLPVPSWLGPRPSPDDYARVNNDSYQLFYNAQGFLKLTNQVSEFVSERIFPDNPLMLGVDHSTSGGVIKALAQRYGADQISVIVIDRHFDGIPLSHRVESDAEMVVGSMPFTGIGGSEYCCGSFLGYLLDNGILPPRNLSLIGVADYPGGEISAAWKNFQTAYLDIEKRGSRFFPLWEFERSYQERLAQFIDAAITTPYLYVSLDLDVGSFNCVHAARYMDGPGISRQNLLDIAAMIARAVRTGRTVIAGVDVMEFNMHFLNMEVEEGVHDRTLEVALEFIRLLLSATAGS